MLVVVRGAGRGPQKGLHTRVGKALKGGTLIINFRLRGITAGRPGPNFLPV